ncbi:uncharacterized protein LOC109829694 [Asparagus officinalis]|uniref:uncharacterized protein LOC109829694 n=1 Tax=Asparagus officinalis TaxID=4686 RepID=UPI00098E79B0|nr:uncharacterized protein LOC109829694 [Asparagus officinalis]
MGEESDSKEKLVREICNISTLFTSCSHIRSSAQKPGFIDWYLILRIDENSGGDVIRRRYRQLALQLHPDKNKHEKAEVAFKLISEAYVCLSDKSRRRAFDIDRKNNFCKDCHRKSQNSTAQKTHKDAPRTKQQYKLLRAFKEVQNRFKEECRVIENCLRVNENARGLESPLFDPSDRLHFPGYPHHRDRVYSLNSFSCSAEYRKVKSESPVYEIRAESRRGWSKSPGFRF